MQSADILLQWVDLEITEAVLLGYYPDSSKMSKKTWIIVWTHLQSDYQTIIWLKEGRTSSLHIVECLVYMAAHDLHTESCWLCPITLICTAWVSWEHVQMHPIIRRIQTNTEGVHLPHIKLLCLNVVGCAVLQWNVIFCLFFLLF